ncbi:GerAB/ArcD/ProY family transporter [Paenibacillus nasutitermitis]|uniref:Spore germination protein KB n=1 Tax=Paenibacillus nasutitermitis TaxID=1652958 RepID=A0A916ZES3_9BACL|nr:endospore germination permease [Paenibacillus nasutitermitis]GGD93368.1 spore germination protein KB [Paenibacillus nasutitermitis]
MDQGKISAFQAAIMMNQAVLASSVLLMPSITTKLAGRDMWMTPIVSSLVGYFLIWLVIRLYRISPWGTFTGLLEWVLGKTPGKICGILFVLFQLHILSIVIHDYGDFIVSNFFVKTPMIMISGSMMLLSIWVLKAGIEVLARCAQLFTPFILFFLLLALLLSMPSFDPSNVLPVFENGLPPILKGSLVVDGWFCQMFLIVYILPQVKDDKKIMKWGLVSITVVGVVMCLTNLSVLMLQSDAAAIYSYSVFMAARYISLSDFLEHVEVMVLLVWVFGAFIKISVFLYALTLSTAQTLGLSNHKAIVVPLGLLVLIMSFWSLPDFQTLARFVSTAGTLYIITGFLLFPILIYIGARIKKRFSPSG